MSQSKLKERRWEVMEIGEEFGPIFVLVDEPLVRAFAFAVDDFNPRYLYAAPGEKRIGHPTLLCRAARDVIATAYDLASGGAGMHTKHECDIVACPTVGETYKITGRHADKYLKRDKQYIVLESEVHDATGTLILRQRSTHIRALRPGVAKNAAPMVGDKAADTAPSQVANSADELRTGSSFRPIRKRFTQEHVTVFAGSDWPNIHNDPATARMAGLRGTVASGLQTMAAVSELMAGYFGDGWTAGGQIAVAFTAPLFVNDSVQVGGTVTEIGEAASRRWMRAAVWCDTDAGVRVLAGETRAWMA
jgi:acyl dehydratase